MVNADDMRIYLAEQWKGAECLLAVWRDELFPNRVFTKLEDFDWSGLIHECGSYDSVGTWHSSLRVDMQKCLELADRFRDIRTRYLKQIEPYRLKLTCAVDVIYDWPRSEIQFEGRDVPDMHQLELVVNIARILKSNSK